MPELTASDFEVLRECMQDKFGLTSDEIGPTTVLETLDLDSLALIELSLLLQKRFGVVIATDDIAPYHTVGELAEVLASAQAKAA